MEEDDVLFIQRYVEPTYYTRKNIKQLVDSIETIAFVD